MKFHSPINQINVTPIVDVMLVLLVIFMLTTPMLINGLDVDLPKSDTKILQDANDHLVVTINKEKKFFLQDTEFSEHNLQVKISHLIKDNPNLRILVKADKNIFYGDVMALISSMYKVGAIHLSLLSDTEE